MIINTKKITLSERVCWIVCIVATIVSGVITYNNLCDVDDMLASCERYAANINTNSSIKD